MLASAWKIVADTLHDLEDEGLSDNNVKTQLKNNEALRSKYLFLYHFVTIVVKMMQERFSVLATTTRIGCLFVDAMPSNYIFSTLCTVLQDQNQR
jgi:hypothetical protein